MELKIILSVKSKIDGKDLQKPFVCDLEAALEFIETYSRTGDEVIVLDSINYVKSI